ncbi:DUF1697 domain-containing protein [Mesorhizobium sp. Z1-4]|uniref:DUF1697 domain-containing protein n=1 Tax=Mesorhizobium sp. Z1-4 TaxID=2448478 RepID=UPI000FDB9C23|nr:DUF1697 domain-containing protein [Mesorhizobium sp. Z1-4]
MTVYVVLFRGVGGATQLPVKPLREQLSAAGFENVVTYINSGNAVVRSALSPDRAVALIAEICAREFAFQKPIYTPTAAEWDALIANNPFPGAVSEPKSVHAAWLAAEPEPADVDTVRSFAVDGEGIEVAGNVAYLHTPHGFGRSKMADMFDKRIGVPNTARNWRTVLALQDLAREAAG